MRLMNTAEGWGAVQRAMHWGVAALILFQLAVGWYMVNVLGQLTVEQFETYQLHKSVGFVVFVLVALRLGWRLANPTPAPPAMPRWQRLASEGAHRALYVLMIALPLSGWLMSTVSPLNDPGAYPRQIENMVFGLFHMPDPFPQGDRALERAFKSVHYFAGLAMAAIVAVHVAAALKHQFVDRDGLLGRMVTGRG